MGKYKIESPRTKVQGFIPSRKSTIPFIPLAKALGFLRGIKNIKMQGLEFLTLLLFAILICGCASLEEAGKGVAGLSTKSVEQARKDALTREFNYDFNTCYQKAQSLLRETGSYIYVQDKAKGMIAVYFSEEDTTPVGIFFKEIDAANTKVEVSSPSTFAKETLAEKLFSGLAGEKEQAKEAKGEESAKE